MSEPSQGWEEATGPLSERLARRQELGIGWLGAHLAQDASHKPGPRAETLVERVLARPAEEGLHDRFLWSQKDRSAIPHDVVAAMNHCQKPYHLWNCERPEVSHPYSLERRPPLSFGGTLEEERGMPERTETSTRALASWVLDQEFEDMMLAHNRQSDREWLSKTLPFGKSDQERTLGPTIDLLAPPSGGGFGMGPPGGFGMGPPGGFSMGPPGEPPPLPPRPPGQT